MSPAASAWARRIAARERGAIARAISAIENETADAAALPAENASHPIEILARAYRG